MQSLHSPLLVARAPFRLRESLKSGQAFRWREGTAPLYELSRSVEPQALGPNEWLSGVAGGRFYMLRQRDDGLEVKSDPAFGEEALRDYLRLDDDPAEIGKAFVIDDFTRSAFTRFNGIRVLRQDPWETMVCFMISATNSVANIERVVGRLCDTYGRRVRVEEDWFSGSVRLFPTPEALARSDEAEMRRVTSMGFRAPFVIQAAKRLVKEEIDLMDFRARSYDETMEFLQSFLGVGEKVADCIALFSLDKPKAFPVDRWIKRVMEKSYFRGRRQSYEKIKARAWKLWGDRAGYANQFLFHQARTTGIIR